MVGPWAWLTQAAAICQPCFAGSQGSAEGSARCLRLIFLPTPLPVFPWQGCCAHPALPTRMLQSTWLPRARTSLLCHGPGSCILSPLIKVGLVGASGVLTMLSSCVPASGTLRALRIPTPFREPRISEEGGFSRGPARNLHPPEAAAGNQAGYPRAFQMALITDI